METISILGPIESLSLTDPEMTLQFWHRINFVIGLASETDRIFEALQEQAIEQIPNSYEPNALKSCGEQAFDYLMSALDEVEGRSDSCLLIPFEVTGRLDQELSGRAFKRISQCEHQVICAAHPVQKAQIPDSCLFLVIRTT